MKRIVLLITIACFVYCENKAQTISIPDANFRKALIKHTWPAQVDLNGDNRISVKEAESFNGSLYITHKDIKDLTGIEHFKNVVELACTGNKLTTLDLSNNTQLEILRCEKNALTQLDLSNQSKLYQLDCGNNPLTSLSLENLPQLYTLTCSHTNIRSLDVSHNPKISWIECSESKLVQANLKGIDMSTRINLCYNPDLTCITVDDVDKANDTWKGEFYYSNIAAETMFGTDCFSNHTIAIIGDYPRMTEVGNSFKFTSASSGQINSTTWNFGDGTITSEEVPTHVYNNAGIYKVQLTVSDESSNDSTHVWVYVGMGTEEAIAIPDKNFKNYLISNQDINLDGNKEISLTEASIFSGTVEVGAKEISNLSGIEFFTNVYGIECWDNDLTTLDLRANEQLHSFNCSRNDLTELLLGSEKLVSLDCSQNDLSTLNLPPKGLGILDCGHNNLTHLDLKRNTEIRELNCYWNFINELNLDGFTSLAFLNCTRNDISTLDLKDSPRLLDLYCGYNNLRYLNLSNCYRLRELRCEYNHLTNLSLINRDILKVLTCSDNDLAQLDIRNTKLTTKDRESFDAVNNPDLMCISISDTSHLSREYCLNTGLIDEQTHFDNDCYSNEFQAIIERNFYKTNINTPLQFNSLSTGTIQSGEWTFGDGTKSPKVHPEHQYKEEGLFTVTLTIKGEKEERSVEALVQVGEELGFIDDLTLFFHSLFD